MSGNTQKINHLKIIFILALLFSNLVFPQEASNKKPCSSAEANQFDFWIGKWKAEWETSDGKKGEGTNTVNRILGNCVIEENFSENSGNALIGKSFSAYDPTIKKWKQTWVDNNGSYMLFTGMYENKKMILEREVINSEGKEIKQRMIFYNIEENSFDWNWEKSADFGETWELSWKIHYSRIN